MNIVPQSPPVESLEFLSCGPTAVGGASLMSSALMLTTPWYTAVSAHPSTSYNSIVHQTAGQMSKSYTSLSVLNMSVVGGNTGKRGNAASNSMALFKNTMNKLGRKAVPPKRQKGYNGYSSSTCSNSRWVDWYSMPLLRSSCELKLLLFLTIQSNNMNSDLKCEI